jgi:hypothetical protein
VLGPRPSVAASDPPVRIFACANKLARQFQIAEADPTEIAHRKLLEGLAPLFAAEGEPPIHLLGQLIGLDFSASPHVQEVLGDEAQFKARAFEAGALCLRRLARADRSSWSSTICTGPIQARSTSCAIS